MSFWKKISSLILVSSVLVSETHATDSTWSNSPTSASWETGGNWIGGTAPTLAGDTASFASSSSTSFLPIQVSSPTTTIAALTFNNGSSFTVSPLTLGTDMLNFDTSPSGGTATISVLSGNHYLQATPSTTGNTFLNSTTNLDITVSLGSLNFQCEGVFANLNFLGGSVNLPNTAPITTDVSVTSLQAADITITNSNVTLVNSGNNTGSNPIVYLLADNITLNSGSLNLINSGSLTASSSTLISNRIDVNSTTTINGGILNLTNTSTASISTSTSTCLGNLFTSDSLIINDGEANIINNANIQSNSSDDTLGSSLDIGNVTLNNGSIKVDNTGSIGNLSRTFGAYLGTTTLTINGGTITNSNSGTLSGSALGSVVGARNLHLNGGIFVNDANVQSDIFTIGNGALYTGVGTTSPAFKGSGTLSVTNSGTVYPADINGNPGTMTIQGDYTQTSSGTFKVLIQDGSTYSKLNITGTASLAGTLQVAQTSGTKLTSGDKFFILNAPTITGTFTNIINENIPISLQPQILYNPDSVELSFLQVIFTPITEKYVKLAQPLFSSLNETNTRLTREMQRLRDHFIKPVRQKSISTTSNQDLALQLVAYGEIQDVETKEKKQRLTESLGATQERPWNFYVGPKGQIGNVYSKDDAQGYKEWSAGAFTGADYAFSQVGVGFLLEYERITGRVGKNWGKFDIDHLHGDTYATYAPAQLPEFAINGILGAGYEWYSVDRNFFETNSGTVKGNPRGAELDALLGFEYAFKNRVFSMIPDGFQVIPMASIQYAYIHIDDFKEKGNSLHAMKVGKQNLKSLRTDLGMRFNYTLETKDVKFSPAVNLNWQREFLDKEYTLNFTPLNFQEYEFSTELPKSGRNIALAGVDFLLTLFDRHELETGYDFEYNSLYHTHFFYMSYNVRF